jgi:glycosyltransferase involved in cell wall biosynthesis
MRVGLDARFLTHPQVGGFKSYLRGLVEGLTSVETSVRFVLYLDRPSAAELETLGPRFEVRIVDGSARLVGLPWREQVLLPFALGRDRLDVFHAPCHTAAYWLRVPLVVTIHDMLWRSQPRTVAHDPKRTALLWYYRAMTMRAIQAARVLLTVSETSRRAICDELPFVDPESVIVAPNAPRACFKPVTDPSARLAVTAQFRLPPQFILGQASADPRKNLPTLIHAFAQLPEWVRRQYPLVVVWAHPELAPSTWALCEALGIAPDVQFLHAVSDRALATIYSMTTIFVFPSLAEGFGMPALEAMACGAPVISGDHPALVETTSDAAWIVDARSVDAVAAAIARALDDEAARRTLSDRGAARARGFTWDHCARQTLAAYARAANGRALDKKSGRARQKPTPARDDG